MTYQPERTPPGSPLYQSGVSSSSPTSHNAFCSCGWLETGWLTERLAAASLSAHLDSNYGKVRTVPSRNLWPEGPPEGDPAP